MFPSFIPVVSAIKPFQKIFASYQRMAAIFWFALSFIIYVSIIYLSSHFATASYVNKAAVPFVQDMARELNYVLDEDLEDTYNISRLESAVDSFDRRYEKVKELIAEKSSGKEDVNRARKWMENSKELRDTLKRRLALLQKEKLTYEEKEELRPKGGDQSMSYFTTRIVAVIDKRFNENEVKEFAVMRVEGFFDGGVVINHVFVSHWLWYIPMIISLFYFIGDFLRPTPIPEERTVEESEDDDNDKLDANK